MGRSEIFDHRRTDAASLTVNYANPFSHWFFHWFKPIFQNKKGHVPGAGFFPADAFVAFKKIRLSVSKAAPS